MLEMEAIYKVEQLVPESVYVKRAEMAFLVPTKAFLQATAMLFAPSG